MISTEEASSAGRPPVVNEMDNVAWRCWLAAIFVVGLAAQAYMASRAWVAGDQAHLLALGWRFASGGPLEPFAKMMTGAGANPGALLQILIGAPLMLVEHHRSPLVIIALFDVAAFALLAVVTRRALGDRTALVFMLLYWLSPWRIYHSSFLWEPQYVLLPAALHLYGCWRVRRERSFTGSMWIGLSIVAAMQLHNSFVVLAVMTVALALRRAIRFRWTGVIVGALIGALPMIPTFVALANDALPAARASQGFLGKGLLHVAPVLKGVLYWPRLGSFDVGNPLAQTLYLEQGFEQHGALNIIARSLQVICVLSIGVAAWASWWYMGPLYRRWRSRRRGESGPAEDGRSAEWRWMRSYALSSLVALVVAAGLSPITLQGWMVIIALHAAVLPVACWIVERALLRRRRLIIALIVVIDLALALVIAHGNRTFRPGEIPEDVRRDHPEILHLISATATEPTHTTL